MTEYDMKTKPDLDIFIAQHSKVAVECIQYQSQSSEHLTTFLKKVNLNRGLI